MTQVNKHKDLTPRQAAACCTTMDDLLVPELFKALCDSTRLRILACLIKCDRPCTVSEIAGCCDVDLSVVSRHLTMLSRAGLLTADKAGRMVHYTARRKHLAGTLHALADAITDCCPVNTLKRPRCSK